MKLTIASGKGGTGKTTLSANLASCLSREKNQKVILADLDVEEPNSALFIQGALTEEKACHKMIPKWESADCTLCGECVKVCNFNAVINMPEEILIFPELCHSCYACSELCPTDSLPMHPVKMGEFRAFHITENFDFVEGRLELGQEQAVPLIGQVIDEVDARVQDGTLKIFDAPPGTSCPVIEASRGSDYVILVTESTPFGLNDLKLAVGTMRVLKQNFGVVINRYGIGGDSVAAYCAQEKIPVIAKIPNDKKIAEIYSKGELIYPYVPAFQEALEKISLFIGAVK